MIPQSILFVCTGNICRSPTAEILFRHMLKEEGLSGIEVFSRGVAATPGQSVAEGSLVALQAIGLNDDHHRSQILEQEDLVKADLIFVMEERHRQMIHLKYPASRRKTFLLKAKADEDGIQDIADPMGGSPSDYEKSRIEIQKCLQSLLSNIKLQTKQGKKEQP
jgi:protein-tyrosine-phosphatase